MDKLNVIYDFGFLGNENLEILEKYKPYYTRMLPNNLFCFFFCDEEADNNNEQFLLLSNYR